MHAIIWRHLTRSSTRSKADLRGQLSGMYIQHEAIEAQKAMVNSPNHTVVYIPVGPMGVPLTGTFNAAGAVPASK